MRLFLAGDVMTGRGIDQILPHPGSPALAEGYVRDAREYVRLAERASGPIPRRAAPEYVWGDALEELARRGPAARIINLETSITARGQPWPGKMVCYRMSPENAACLRALAPDVCALANNHVLDFGEDGLLDTLGTLEDLGLPWAGAGRDRAEAWRPARVGLPDGRAVIVSAVGAPDCGIPPRWTAAAERAGVAVVRDLSLASADAVAERATADKRSRDVSVVSIHLGSNWGYGVPEAHRRFARRLVERGVDVVHGHSSHHPRPIEVHRGRLILYGAGDFLDDYEGITGYEAYRDDLALMYFPTLAEDGALRELSMTPMRIRGMRLSRAPSADVDWLAGVLDRMSAGLRVERAAHGTLRAWG